MYGPTWVRFLLLSFQFRTHLCQTRVVSTCILGFEHCSDVTLDIAAALSTQLLRPAKNRFSELEVHLK